MAFWLGIAAPGVIAAAWVAWCSHFGWPEPPPEQLAGVYDSRNVEPFRHWGLQQPAYWAESQPVACAPCPESYLVLCWKPQRLQMTDEAWLKACARGRW